MIFNKFLFFKYVEPSPKTESIQPTLTTMKPTSGEVKKSGKTTKTAEAATSTQSFLAEDRTTAVVKSFLRKPTRYKSVTPSSEAVFTGSFSVEQTLPTELILVRQQKDSNGSFYVILSIGCSIFMFCASVVCVSIIIIRRKR